MVRKGGLCFPWAPKKFLSLKTLCFQKINFPMHSPHWKIRFQTYPISWDLLAWPNPLANLLHFWATPFPSSALPLWTFTLAHISYWFLFLQTAALYPLPPNNDPCPTSHSCTLGCDTSQPTEKTPLVQPSLLSFSNGPQPADGSSSPTDLHAFLDPTELNFFVV